MTGVLRAGVVSAVVLALATVDWAAGSTYLRVDQAGWLPSETKTVLALADEDLGGEPFLVRDAETGATVLTGSVGADRGPYGSFAHVFELDVTGLEGPGEFEVVLGDPATPLAVSPRFRVGEDALAPVIPVSLRFFQVQRCGDTSPRMHGPCHLNHGIADGGPRDGEPVDLRGGWHDAGDYLHFTGEEAAAVLLLLVAFDEHPGSFSDADGDGVPEVLEEARVGVEWLLRAWDGESEALYFQLGDESDHGEWRMPEGDDASDDPRLRHRTAWACRPGKGANVAGRVAGALALASRAWGDGAGPWQDPDLAGRCLAAARAVYAWGKGRRAVQHKTFDRMEDTWKDDLAVGATELWIATGETSYRDDARHWCDRMGHAWSFSAGDLHAVARARFGMHDPGSRDGAIAWLEEELDNYEALSLSHPFREALEEPYWGCAADMAGAGLLALWHGALAGTDARRDLARRQRDYLLGRNPWGVAFVNGVGSAWPHHPHHQVADPALNPGQPELVGYWAEGPTTRREFEDEGISLDGPDPYAPFQSDYAVWHDDRADYVTNEPTIFMNAAGIAFLAAFEPPRGCEGAAGDRTEPAEVTGLRVDGVDPARVTWQAAPGADQYDVTRGRPAGLAGGDLGECRDDPRPADLVFEDGERPPAGGAFTYLARAFSLACLRGGSLGRDSAGRERTNANPAACP